MIPLRPPSGPLTVLALGAHPDDIEIGCGGTLLRLAERPRTTVHGLVLTGAPGRRQEAEVALPSFFPGATLDVLGLPDGQLPSHWSDVKQALEDLAGRIQPGLILAPRIDDAHQDHRTLGAVVASVWRDTLTLHYEIPKWDGDLKPPSHYVPLSDEQAHRKVELLHAAYPSQHARDWWDAELFLGLMRLRGVECRARYAEALHSQKVVLGLAET